MNDKIFYILLICAFAFSGLDAMPPNEITKGSIVKIDDGQQFGRQDQELSNSQGQQMKTETGVIYSSNAGGIFLTLPKSTNSIKLFALTGQLIWSGDLVQGKFYIPTGPGIYFLRINNKSYKVSCK